MSAHALGQRLQELQGEVRVAAHEAAHVAGEERHGRGVLDRLGRRRASLAAEHRELPEEPARAHLGERDHPAVLVLAREQHRTRANQVTGVAGVPLAEQDLAPLPAARHGHLRELLELARVQSREDLGVREQPGRLLSRGHRRIISHVVASESWR